MNSSSKSNFHFFWSSDSPFSQWYPSVFVVDDTEYCNAEQFMMAEKAKLFQDDKIRIQILETNDSKTIKALGRKVSGFDESIWTSKRKSIVKTGSLAKFSQNNELLDALLDTSGLTLVEASPYDKIWGIGLSATHSHAKVPSKWKGLNLLGEILTEVREELSEY